MTSTNSHSLFEDTQPWDSPVDGEDLGDELLDLLNNYLVLPPHADIAIVLWVFGTYVFDEFRIFPRLCITSPEKRCGKSTCMEVIDTLVRSPLPTSHATPAAIFRGIEKWHPTLLMDEADTYIHHNNELRMVINSGHTKRLARVVRTAANGKNFEPESFSTWSPLVLAMIRMPPDTIKDRSIVVKLRRKTPQEDVKRLPQTIFESNEALRRKLARWADDNKEKLASATFELPNAGSDRAKDNWYSLLSIASVLGAKWENRCRDAMKILECRAEDQSIGVMLLEDIWDVFEQQKIERIASADLVNKLIELEHRPWPEWTDRLPLSARGLARLLSAFDIHPKPMRVSGSAVPCRGYERGWFVEAVERYSEKRN